MKNSHKRTEEVTELKNIKNQKFGGLVKRTLEDQIKYLEKLKKKNLPKFEKEIKLFRDKISDFISLQEDNKKISEDNLEIYENNIEIEKRNISISIKNKEYLDNLYSKINDL